MPRKTNHKIEHTVSPTITPINAPINAHTYEKPSLGSTILQGFALGTGQSLAFNLFRSEPVIKEVKEKEINYKEFVQCMKDNPYEDCKQYLNL